MLFKKRKELKIINIGITICDGSDAVEGGWLELQIKTNQYKVEIKKRF